MLGTLEILELANECMTLSAFIYMSPLQTAAGSGTEDRLLPIPGNEDPESILSTILSSSLDGNLDTRRCCRDTKKPL